MQQDAREITRNCESCQSFTPPEKLTAMSSSWPFAQWGIGLIGLLPNGQGAAIHAIITIDYFIKWVEVETLKSYHKEENNQVHLEKHYMQVRDSLCAHNK